jgi:molecular chaperone GrpE (heat shock protein)
MDEGRYPRVPKWPFFLGDAIMLGLAFFIYWQGAAPLPLAEILAGSLCVLLGALLAVTPFVMEYRALLKTIEVSALGGAMEKIQNLETLSAHIGSATSHWELAHEAAEKTSTSARQISEQMAIELKDFKEFLQQANENEKATLRLEVEKLRRGETEWVQTLIRVMDHIYALHVAAERSGQPQLSGQIGNFQNACRETARKVGLVPFVAGPAEKFDAKRHQTAGGNQPAEGTPITETLATGYTYQGRQLRSALVKVAGSSREVQPPTRGSSADQSSLPLESTVKA